MLNDYNLEIFHMTDFLARRPPFDQWSNGTCEECFSRLVEIINTYNVRGFAVQVSWDDYEKRLSARVMKAFTKHPYVLVFDTVITELLRVMYFMPVGEQLTMILDNSTLRSKAQKVYDRRRLRDRWGSRLTESPWFVSDSDFLPLQAADILANLMRNYARGLVGSELPMQEIHRYLRLLIATNPPIVRVLTSDDLDAAEKHLSQFLHD